jgi:hypothetical protein
VLRRGKERNMENWERSRSLLCRLIFGNGGGVYLLCRLRLRRSLLGEVGGSGRGCHAFARGCRLRLGERLGRMGPGIW